ncbi:MAG: TIM-barrel domain-containing protein [Myxococcota bacterium]
MRTGSWAGMLVLVTTLSACPQPEPGSSDAGPTTTDPCAFTEPPIPAAPRHTPRWAFEPWISKDISDGPDTYAFVQGFKDRNIPVGVVVLDSPWETNYNTFIPNPDRYPNFGQMVADLRAQGVRTVLWVTQMVNEESYDLEPGGDVYETEAENFQQGWECHFFVNDAETYLWWKGRGAGVDFFNPRARAWWHQQQDPLLEMGLAGWKLDFGEDYITTSTIRTAQGEVTHQEYSEAYYRDYLEYGVFRRGVEEFVTMVRPYDKSYQFPGRFYARPEHAPVAWVGDNRRDYVGLEDALDHIFRSAAAGYVVVGSDIGGYLDVDDSNVAGDRIPFSQEVFARWTAVGALTPFMQLHGRANITPWTVPERVEETVTLYRYWSVLHHELVPFFYSLAEEAYAGGPNLLRPVGDLAQWAGDYRFQLGDAFLVAPILDATGRRDVALPDGAEWVDWWTGESHPGGTTVADYDATDRARLPLFIRAGAIVPMDISSDVTGLGNASHAGHLTVLVHPAAASSTFTLHDEDGATTVLNALGGSPVRVTLSRAVKPVYLRIRASAPSSVTAGGTALTQVADKSALDALASGWNVAGNDVWVKLPSSSGAVEVVLDN